MKEGTFQRRANRRCAALSRSVQRLKGARSAAGLDLSPKFPPWLGYWLGIFILLGEYTRYTFIVFPRVLDKIV